MGNFFRQQPQGDVAPNPTVPVNAPNPPAAVNKPVPLWRQILAGALIGLSGADPEHPEASFGGGMRAVQNFQDRQLKQKMLIQAQQREQEELGLKKQQVGLDQQRVDFERQWLGLETRKTDELAALTVLNKLRLEKEIAQMDDEKQRKWTETMAQYIQALSQAHAQIKFITSDSVESMMAAAQEFGPKQDKKVLVPGQGYNQVPTEQTIKESPLFNQLMPVHDRANHSILYFERSDDVKKFGPDTPDVVLPNGRHIKVAGQPIALTDARFHLEATIAAATINAEADKERYRWAKESAEKPLTTKEALQQARQEISPLIEADAYLPESRRQYKDQTAVTKAVNKRAQELLDLDSQLRRSGVKQTANVIGVLGALKSLRQRGASDTQLKQQIAQAASAGTLTAQEIVALYDRLGLVPGIQPRPQVAAPSQPQAIAPVPAHALSVEPQSNANVITPAPESIAVTRGLEK